MANANSCQQATSEISTCHQLAILLVCLMMFIGCKSKCEKRLDEFNAAVNRTPLIQQELQTSAGHRRIMQRYNTRRAEPHEKVFVLPSFTLQKT